MLKVGRRELGEEFGDVSRRDRVGEKPALSGVASGVAEFVELGRLFDAFGDDPEVEVVSDDTLSVDRTLDSSRFRAAAEWSPPSWQAMLAELAADPTPYPAVLDDNAHG